MRQPRMHMKSGPVHIEDWVELLDRTSIPYTMSFIEATFKSLCVATADGVLTLTCDDAGLVTGWDSESIEVRKPIQCTAQVKDQQASRQLSLLLS